MAKNSKLESGFLFLYDWLPAIENLPAKEVKTLLLALIARQRENKPFPLFSNALTASYARMIEPSIKRRIIAAGAARGGEDAPTLAPEDGGEEGGDHPSPLSRAEISKEKQKKDKSFLKQSGATAPQGAYSGARAQGAGGAAETAQKKRERVYASLGGSAAKREGKNAPDNSSFDIDEFFAAALAGTYGGQNFT